MVSEIIEVLEKIAYGVSQKHKIEDIIKSIDTNDKKLVSAAYSWIYDKMKSENRDNGNSLGSNQSKRIASNEEVSKIGLQNMDYLLHFYNIGLLNDIELNNLIENLKLIPEERIDKDIINLFVLNLFWNVNEYMLPGSRLTLNHFDTIN
jgi:uncharacterized protein Smg (DUF494 family)